MSEKRRKSHSNTHSAKITDYVDARPRNWLMPVALVLLKEYSSYGYELWRRMRELGFEDMNPGTLYRALRKMGKDGLCKSKWETTSSGGPARRMYSITDRGETYLGSWVKSLEQYRRNIEAFFKLIGVVL